MLVLFSSAFVSFSSLPASCPDNSVSDPPIPGVLQGKGSGQGHVLLAMVRVRGRCTQPLAHCTHTSQRLLHAQERTPYLPRAGTRLSTVHAIHLQRP